MSDEPNDQELSEPEAVSEKAPCGYSHLTLEEQIAALTGDLENARLEASQNLDQAQRSQAELVNYRKRADDERIAMGKYSNSRLITRVLPVIEELDLAIAHADNTGPSATWLEGVKLIQRKLLSLLESEGVATIEAVGEPFNPLEHEALGTEESTEYQPGYVMQALRTGYRLHDRVIQPAQVIVAREAQVAELNAEHAGESTEAEETEHA